MKLVILTLFGITGYVICHSFYDVPHSFVEEYERSAAKEEPYYNRDFYSRNESPVHLEYSTESQTRNSTFYLGARPPGISKQRYNVRSEIAREILRDIDFNVDPCDNFYQFACGGFIRSQNLSKGFRYKVESIRAKINHAVRTAVEVEVSYSEPRPLSLAKHFFASCIDEGRIESNAKEDVLNFITDIGGWGTLGYTTTQPFDFERKLASNYAFFGNSATAYNTGGAIIGLRIVRDFFQAGKYCFFLDRPQLGQHGNIGSSNYKLYLVPKDSIYTRAYTQYGVDIAVALGANPETAARDMNDIVDFEIELAKIMIPTYGQLPSRALTVSELTFRYTSFDWLRFLRLIAAYSGVNINIGPSTRVSLWAQSYYDKLFPLLRSVSTRTISNYIMWRSILPFIETMGREFQLIRLKYISTLNGAEQPELIPREYFCAKVVILQMPWISGRIFVERKMDGAILEMARTVKNYLRQTFRALLARSNWIDETTRRKNLIKFDLIDDEIGFPNYLLDNVWLDDLYKNFVIQRYSFFQNMKEVSTQNFANGLRQLIHPQLDLWVTSPLSLNAMYERVRNTVVFAAGLMDEPVIHPDYPMSLVFGGYGFFHAHEYQHAFDTLGINFDWRGHLNRNFWSRASKINFNRKSRCLKRQFSSYFLPDFRLMIRNGQTTFNEALPDFVGVKVAYDSYQTWKMNNRYGDTLENLPFTGNQLFFINYARQWCSKFSREYITKYSLLSSHPLNRLRAIAPLQNMVEFSRSFQCPIGSTMNPVIKCSF